STEGQAPPETPTKIPKFGIFVLLQGGHFRLQSHTAFRTVPRAELAHLWMHGTGVPGITVLGFGFLFKISQGIGVELGLTTGTAKIVGFTLKVGLMLRVSGDRHTADGIF